MILQGFTLPLKTDLYPHLFAHRYPVTGKTLPMTACTVSAVKYFPILAVFLEISRGKILPKFAHGVTLYKNWHGVHNFVWVKPSPDTGGDPRSGRWSLTRTLGANPRLS